MSLRDNINQKDKEASMNEKLQIWSFLNTDMMTLSKQVVEGNCFKKGEQ